MKFNNYVEAYLRNFKNAKEEWNYEDGCVLTGAIFLYKATNNQIYRDFLLKYVDSYIDEEGNIKGYIKDSYNIDDINTGKVLFFAYEQTKNEKYRKAIELLMNQLRNHPRTKSRNFWHKEIYPNQIWLDGLYMAQPFYMTYDTMFGNKENYSDIIEQFKNVRTYLYDDKKLLYYHAYDEAKIQPWADKETGHSPNFWLRAMGWYLMALIDTMEELAVEASAENVQLEVLFQEAIIGILKYQDTKSKLFFQVIDRPEVEGNYLETSGSAMVAYAILKACSMEVLQKEEYQKIGEDILFALIDSKLIEEDGMLMLKDICSVAGLGPGTARDGSVAYYLSEPVVCDDQKGTGAFMMAYARMLMLKQE